MRERQRCGIRRRARTRVNTWSNKLMAVPVDADTRVRESFVTAVERDVVINLAFVIFRILLRAGHTGFFVGREDENQIAFGFDLSSVEGADRGEERFDVARVVADSGRVNTAVAHSGFDLQTRLKDCVHVSVEDRDWTTAAA